MSLYAVAVGFSDHFLNSERFLRDSSNVKFPLLVEAIEDKNSLSDQDILAYSRELKVSFYPERFIFKK